MAVILLIDDDEDVRRTIKAMLESGRHKVVVAEDGTEGVRIFDMQPIDLVVTDIVMPHGDGLEVITRMKRRQSDLPIIGMSGVSAKEAVLEMAVMSGADVVLEKPLPRDELLQHVDRCLGK